MVLPQLEPRRVFRRVDCVELFQSKEVRFKKTVSKKAPKKKTKRRLRRARTRA
jgi:hypothetical protein